ncbi:hypothetical protein KFL_000020780 [Klebsormidium nitens]|uniref:SAM domain-containing protein n=1 Tax=Klebsormidium nitens TaxID=105231 RepID=A0A1Y1HME3_KLENI|nr:hypothetical protein KFL_000020780 [Klebsormidium nitens]|eukprot:GAQ77717.1 hypothetical protein KFL_000020780 [Klebsormidium nitens]
METFLLKYGEYEAGLQALREDSRPTLARSDSSPDPLKRHVAITDLASPPPWVSPLLKQSLEGPSRKTSRFKSEGPQKEQDHESTQELPSGYVSDDVSGGGGPAPRWGRKLDRTRTPPRRSLGSVLLGQIPLKASGTFSGMAAEENTDPRTDSLDLEDGMKWKTGLGVPDGLGDPPGLFEMLDGMGLGRYASVLEEAEVTVDILSTMTPEQLKEAGVQAIGARLRILEAFRAPKATSSP